jgi:hypothetical protein
LQNGDDVRNKRHAPHDPRAGGVQSVTLFLTSG